ADENASRPGRSVRDLCAVIKEAGTYDPDIGGVRGKVKPFAPYRDLLLDEDFAANIGLSIRGSATDLVDGEAEGRTGKIVESLAAITSVDFVTRAGRGGHVLGVLESEAVTDRAIARGVEEATADERRQQLSDAVRTEHGNGRRYAWVRDFDESTVWFEASAEDEPSKTWQQTYTVADDDLSVSLTGDRTEVRPVTKYVPATRSDSTTTTTEDDQEVTMGNIQIDEAEHNRIVERAGRVDVLESERDTAIRERDEARSERDSLRRTVRAGEIVTERATEAGVEFDDLQIVGLLAQLPLTEAGELDEETFATTVDEHAAKRKVAEGTGRVIGMGGTTTTGGSAVSLTDIDEALGLGKEA
ncbi:hypothetical protein, partial [Nocardioides massiliensis]